MSKELKTLEEHNKEAREKYSKRQESQPNGIACPECGGELVDDDSGMSLMSNPPQKNVICLCGGYRGYRVA